MPGDPKCASEQEIEDWVQNKKTSLRYITRKLEFKNFGDDPTKYEEKWFPTTPLAVGNFSDNGYYFYLLCCKSLIIYLILLLPTVKYIDMLRHFDFYTIYNIV